MKKIVLFILFLLSPVLLYAQVQKFPLPKTENPGRLKFFIFVPEETQSYQYLLVFLHGCLENLQSARNTGFESFAGAYQYIILYPVQQVQNNIYRCFNWFAKDNQSGNAEVKSILNAISLAKTKYKIQHKSILAGFSAGGYMAQLLASLSPNSFLAMLSVAGGPPKCAQSIFEIRTCTSGKPTFSKEEWFKKGKKQGQLFPQKLAFVMLVHGLKDDVVNPNNFLWSGYYWAGFFNLPTKPNSVEKNSDFILRHYRSSNAKMQRILFHDLPHAFPIDENTSCGTLDKYKRNTRCIAKDFLTRVFYHKK